MSVNKNERDAESNCLSAEMRRQLELRSQSYRERALKMFPWICARCGREFGGRKLRELTVHHKDHNHEYNPPDGSNWELLCLYCHEYEHTKFPETTGDPIRTDSSSRQPSSTFQPFADLARRLKK